MLTFQTRSFLMQTRNICLALPYFGYHQSEELKSKFGILVSKYFSNVDISLVNKFTTWSLFRYKDLLTPKGSARFPGARVSLCTVCVWVRGLYVPYSSCFLPSMLAGVLEQALLWQLRTDSSALTAPHWQLSTDSSALTAQHWQLRTDSSALTAPHWQLCIDSSALTVQHWQLLTDSSALTAPPQSMYTHTDV